LFGYFQKVVGNKDRWSFLLGEWVTLYNGPDIGQVKVKFTNCHTCEYYNDVI